MSDEAGGAVAGQLPVGAVASVEAGVVAGFIAAHGHGQLGPSGRKGKVTSVSLFRVKLGGFYTNNKTGGGSVVIGLKTSHNSQQQRSKQPGKGKKKVTSEHENL